jgi:DNA-binding transcriptional LysR family regulator
VTVDATRQVVQLPSEQFDVAIRSSRESLPKLSCDLLGRISLVPVGAPNYLHQLLHDGFALQAAVDGLGLAIGRLPLIDDDLASGRLAIAVNHVVPVISGYWLVKQPGIEPRREVAAFCNWLVKEMAQLNWNGADARAAQQSV